MASSYLGLLVDWGGVMTTSVFDAFQTFCVAEGLSPETVSEHFRGHDESRELLIGLETGALPEDEFELRFAAILSVDPAGLIARMFAAAQADATMLGAVRHARAAGVRTGLISNSWGTQGYDRALLAELFDGVVISGEVGIRKPAREIYGLGARALELAPEQCVFVDDLAFNLAPAAKLGMATVHHIASDRTVAELERLLGVALR
jgi:putative hydrolase of the HAD superfamily